MVVRFQEHQEDKPRYTSTFHVFARVTYAVFPLAKTRQKAKPRWGRALLKDMDARNHEQIEVPLQSVQQVSKLIARTDIMMISRNHHNKIRKLQTCLGHRVLSVHATTAISDAISLK